jgi:hypothetical protein
MSPQGAAHQSIAMRWMLVSVYLVPMLYVHFRGKIRLPIGRQLFDHSSFMAPINKELLVLCRDRT